MVNKLNQNIGLHVARTACKKMHQRTAGPIQLENFVKCISLLFSLAAEEGGWYFMHKYNLTACIHHTYFKLENMLHSPDPPLHSLFFSFFIFAIFTFKMVVESLVSPVPMHSDISACAYFGFKI